MSLFGGSLASSTQSTSTDDESEGSTTPPATTAEAQDAQLPDIPEADDDDDSDDDDSDYNAEDESEADSEDEVAVDVRQNRFKGKASTWRGYTEADRDLAKSLTQLESGDLAAHLYNAHALKRRVRLPVVEIKNVDNWRSKDTWLKRGEQLAFTDAAGEEQVELVPSKKWTAWPLPPHIVPASNERFGRRRSNAEGQGWSIGGLGEANPGDELREEVLAVMLRVGKEQWEGRESEADEIADGRSRSRSKGVQAKHRTSATDDSDIDMHRTAGEDDGSSSPKHSETQSPHPPADRKRAYRRKPPIQVSKPALLADEERARRLLLPSTNSLLARIDTLAAAIRRSRLNQFGHGAYSDTSGSEMVTDGGSGSSHSRSISRSRSKGAASRGKAAGSSSRARSASKASRTVAPQKKGSQHEGALSFDDESASDFGADYMGKRAGQSGTQPPGRNGVSTASEELPIRPGQIYSGLIDWSEVLGLASIIGWDEGAIARTAGRCAALFEESMDFRRFDATSSGLPQPVQFTPSTIPNLDPWNLREPRLEKRPYFSKDALRCPHANCDSYRHEFGTHYRVVQHIVRQHGYDPRENDSDNEDRTYGGVHIDGFLQPIAPKKGWIGRGRSKSVDSRSTRRRKVKKEEDGSASSFEGSSADD